MSEVICPYCNAKAKLVSSAAVYGKHYGKIWLCSNYPKCDSFVGVHKDTDKPLGTMANKLTRWWRKKTHESIDWLWKDKVMSRKNVYYAIKNLMNMTEDQAHIGKFTADQCKELIRVFKENLLIK